MNYFCITSTMASHGAEDTNVKCGPYNKYKNSVKSAKKHCYQGAVKQCKFEGRGMRLSLGLFFWE